jgi:hypothetical protein
MTTTSDDLMREAEELREQAAPAKAHVLHITDETGDTRIMWDPAVKDETDTAKAAFDKGKKKGMLAYSVDADSGERTGEVIREFDPQAGKIIMVRQTRGG